jgi:hypothetical protein
MTGVESDDIVFQDYLDESQLEYVTRLVENDLSEPYSSTLHPTSPTLRTIQKISHSLIAIL